MIGDSGWIAAHIPHRGNMCLLDRVLEWDDERVRCAALSHRDPGNPLRAGGMLSAVHGIEYAAQAMAVHRALRELDDEARAPRGMLASVRDVTLHVDRLDDIGGEIAVDANRVSGDLDVVLYEFRIDAGGRVLVSGRVAALLDVDRLAERR